MDYIYNQLKYYFTTEIDLQIGEVLPKDIHLYRHLIRLDCSRRQISTLPENLPDSIQILHCSMCQFTSLPDNLPSSLQILYCSGNQLTSLPNNLPSSLQILYCSNNQITALPNNLPDTLKLLDCSNNQITALPCGLGHLHQLNCDNNHFSLKYKLNLETLKQYYSEK